MRDEWQLPVVVSTHPRTRKRLASVAGDVDLDGLRFLEPFGFNDYNKLQLESRAVLSDSGTIAEESSLLGFAAVTLRDSIERPEALDTGSILMTGLVAEEVVENVREVISNPPPSTLPAGYEINDTSQRVVRFILSTHGRADEWRGLRRWPTS